MTGSKSQPPSVPLGLRVTKVATKAEPEGGATAILTVAGQARGLIGLIGEPVIISTVEKGRSLRARLFSVTVSASKVEGKKELSAKLSGGRELNELVDLMVNIEGAQKRLPGAEDPPEEEATLGTAATVQEVKGRGKKKRGKDAAAGD